MKKISTLLFLFFFLLNAANAKACQINDRLCVIQDLEKTAATITTPAWSDQIYRELAKTYAFEKQSEKAIGLIQKIKNPDTKALTIRGIGMAVADSDLSREDEMITFQALRGEAEKIHHPQSYAIALTYIAMAQAFAGNHEGSWSTAADMKNDALRHKAYAESAEIQAEQGAYTEALKSISFIDSESFRNKAYVIVGKIFADSCKLQKALEISGYITNSYKKAATLQYILDKQKPREVTFQVHKKQNETKHCD